MSILHVQISAGRHYEHLTYWSPNDMILLCIILRRFNGVVAAITTIVGPFIPAIAAIGIIQLLGRAELYKIQLILISLILDLGFGTVACLRRDIGLQSIQGNEDMGH